MGAFCTIHYEEIHVFIVQKNLVLRNRWSDFEIISHDSGRNCYRQAALTICQPAGQVKLLVCYCQFGSLLQIPVVFGL